MTHSQGSTYVRLSRPAMVGLLIAIALEKVDINLEAALPFPTPIFTIAACLFLGLSSRAILAFNFDRLPGPGKLLIFWIYLVGIQTALLIAIGVTRLAEGLGSTMATYMHFVFFVLVAVVMGLGLSRRDIMLIHRCISAIATICTVIGLIQAVDQNILDFGFSDLLGLRSRVGLYYVRPTSIFSEPAYFGYFSLLGVFSSLAFAELGARGSSLRKTAHVAASICSVGVILPLGLGPIVVGSTILVILLVSALLKGRLSSVLLGVLCIAFVLATPIGSGALARVESVLDSTDSSANVRTALNEISLSLIAENPLTGLGVGQSGGAFAGKIALEGVDEVPSSQAGNSYLYLAGEQGVLLTGLFVSAIVVLLLRLRRKSFSDLLCRISAAQLFTYIVAWFFVSSVSLPTFWIVLGLALSAARVASDPESPVDAASGFSESKSRRLYGSRS